MPYFEKETAVTEGSSGGTKGETVMDKASRIIAFIMLVMLSVALAVGITPPKAEAASALGKTMGLNVFGTPYWFYPNPNDARGDTHVSHFMDNVKTSQDEGAYYKKTWFKNPMIYVPYDYFVNEPLDHNNSFFYPFGNYPVGTPKWVVGRDKYKKLIDQLKSWNPDSIAVCFLTRLDLPMHNFTTGNVWSGWGKTPVGADHALQYPSTDAKAAVGLDLDQWSFAMKKFAQLFGADVDYYDDGRANWHASTWYPYVAWIKETKGL